MKILYDNEIVYHIKDTRVVESCGIPYWEAFVKIQKEHPELGFQFYLREEGRLDWRISYLSAAKKYGKKIVVLDRQRSE